ncbi:MAG TPA: hypothetical protein VFR48_11355 [Solirubrobacteraceae bacterium]|nr:hypothetical protein [Solirubrobacteraceae bacterium]
MGIVALVASTACLCGSIAAPALAAAPLVGTDGAHATSPTTAWVGGNADPEGPATTLHADYKPAVDLWCTSEGVEGTPQETSSQPLGSGNAMFSEITVDLIGLKPATEYCAELAGENEDGSSHGALVRFTTPARSEPTIDSESVTGLAGAHVTLEAQIDAKGEADRYQFQLVSQASEYASEIDCPEPALGPLLCVGPHAAGALPIGFLSAGSGQRTVSLDLAGAGVVLQRGKTYHYRVLAAPSIASEDTIEWEGPAVLGGDQAFTVPEAAAPGKGPGGGSPGPPSTGQEKHSGGGSQTGHAKKHRHHHPRHKHHRHRRHHHKHRRHHRR